MLPVSAEGACYRYSKTNTASGLKGRVLKECAIQLGSVITQLFQHLLESSCIPQVWKHTTIIPVPKMCHATTTSNSIPVALISVLCKYMEREVCDHLLFCSDRKKELFGT